MNTHSFTLSCARRLLLGALSVLPMAYAGTSFAQSTEMFEIAASSEKPHAPYVLPKQNLTYQVLANQILSDLALNRGDLATAYKGYTYLAKKTRDPRYAERAYWVAALANDTEGALAASELLKSIAPHATLGKGLSEQVQLKKILERSEQGQLQEAYADTKAFLKTHPNHEVGLSLLADIASKLKYDADALYAFEHLYELAPNDAEAMNNLAYYLVDHNIRLTEADALVKRALKKSPKAAHIMDTAAWLAYRQNKLPQALSWAKKARAGSDSPDIGLHLAEILWVSGDQTAAQVLFKQLKFENLGKPEFQENLRAIVQRLGVTLD